jgi:hypothetical protein
MTLWAIFDPAVGPSVPRVKLTTSPSPEDLARLTKTADLVGAEHRVLVSQTPRTVEGPRGLSCDLAGLLGRLAA